MKERVINTFDLCELVGKCVVYLKSKGIENVDYSYSQHPCNDDDYFVDVTIRIKDLVKRAYYDNSDGLEFKIRCKGCEFYYRRYEFILTYEEELEEELAWFQDDEES